MATNHPKYYFSDGNLLLQVGSRRFRIHRYLIEGSTLVRRFLPTERDPLKEFDASEYRPLCSNTSDEAFEAFLDVLYHPGGVEPGVIPTSTLIAALDVAEDCHAAAISKRIRDELLLRKTDGTLSFSVAMLKCSLRHPTRFPRTFVVEHFSSICGSRAPITASHLTNIENSMIAMIIEGRGIYCSPNSLSFSRESGLVVKYETWWPFLQRAIPLRTSDKAILLAIAYSSIATLLVCLLRIVCGLGRLLFKRDTPRKSKKFYFLDGTIVCQAEYTQYRVHQYLFQNSTLDINLPLPARYSEEDLERGYPIPLPGIRAEQFEALLEIIYLPPFSDPRVLSNSSLMIALDIADRYALDDVCVRIVDILRSRHYGNTMRDTFAMLKCCLRHPSRFPREEVIRMFTAICTSQTRIDEEHIEGMNTRIIAYIIQGREQVLLGALRWRAVGSRYDWKGDWPVPSGWVAFTAKIFPATSIEGEWRVMEDEVESGRL